MRQLIVNADDFGFTRDVNEGIIEAHRQGILTAATMMAVGGAFHQALLLAKDFPSLDVGIHLVLVGERALSRPAKALPGSPYQLIWDNSLDIEREFDLQIRRVLDAGIKPTHIDTHKHTHVLPKVARAVVKMSKQYGIPWVRRPLPHAGYWSVRILQAGGCRMTDHFTGFRQTGKLDTPELVSMIKALPEGLTELMVHPGFCRDELSKAKTRLKQSRQTELEALMSPAVKKAIEEAGVALTSYKVLTNAANTQQTSA
ncbi:MAG: ChbG/HpnK family deacetylase [Bryobacterales bacterium]|nr:ChbG/HpnK family deacetylase [Bryobacterales bacterium]